MLRCWQMSNSETKTAFGGDQKNALLRNLHLKLSRRNPAKNKNEPHPVPPLNFSKKLSFGLPLGPGTKPVVWFCLGKIHSPFILIHSHTHYIYTVIQILQMPRQVKTSSYLCLWWLASVFSRMSNFVLNLNLYCPLSQQNRPAQQHSILQLTLRKTFWNCINLSRNSQLSRCVALWNDNSFWLLFPGAWV